MVIADLNSFPGSASCQLRQALSVKPLLKHYVALRKSCIPYFNIKLLFLEILDFNSNSELSPIHRSKTCWPPPLQARNAPERDIAACAHRGRLATVHRSPCATWHGRRGWGPKLPLPCAPLPCISCRRLRPVPAWHALRCGSLCPAPRWTTNGWRLLCPTLSPPPACPWPPIKGHRSFRRTHRDCHWASGARQNHYRLPLLLSTVSSPSQVDSCPPELSTATSSPYSWSLGYKPALPTEHVTGNDASTTVVPWLHRLSSSTAPLTLPSIKIEPYVRLNHSPALFLANPAASSPDFSSHYRSVHQGPYCRTRGLSRVLNEKIKDLFAKGKLPDLGSPCWNL
jgi:hypothetical protein